MNSSGSGELKFHVDAGLLFQLGEQLVTRRSVALAELIKNAYDADATIVKVSLLDITEKGGTIIIEDNGIGMSFEDIRDNWMRIATTMKRDEPISRVYCRPRTGEKGVGRFAARRLSGVLLLESVHENPSGVKQKTRVRFDWKNEFTSGKTLTNIPVEYETLSVDPEQQIGVTLTLLETQDIWSEEDLIELERDILSLVSPFPQADHLDFSDREDECLPDPGFRVEFNAPEFPEFTGGLEDRFLRAAWGVLEGIVDEKGIPSYQLEIREVGESIEFKPENETFASLVGARFRIHFFVYRKEFLEGFDIRTQDAQRKGRDYGGVRIYSDRFRVFPYGDPGDDWLRLNELRAGRVYGVPESLEFLTEEAGVARPFLLLPGNNQLFGAVEVSRLKHPGIEINISRERLVENETFSSLRRFVQIGIYWMTLQYAKRRASQRREEPEERETLTRNIERVIEEVSRAEAIPEPKKSAIVQSLRRIKNIAELCEEKYISEIGMLRVLSATGATVALIDHQLRAVLEGIRSIHTDLEEIKGKVSPKVARRALDAIATRTWDWYHLASQQVAELGHLLGKPARDRRQRNNLRNAVDQVISTFALYIKDYDIEVLNEVPKALRLPPMYEAELHTILIHVLTNALKAVRGQELRRICFLAEREGDSIEVHIYDTGVGVPTRMREKAFEAFETTSTPDPILGIGTGLGLKVVRDIVEDYGGQVFFAEQVTGKWSTCLTIRLPNG